MTELLTPAQLAAAAYALRRPSLLDQVRAFFDANRDEELTYKMVMTKFGCTYNTAIQVIKALDEAGYLERVHVIRLRVKGIAKDEVTT